MPETDRHRLTFLELLTELAYLDWHAVVKLYPRDSPELDGQAESVAQSEVLRHLIQVPGHVAGEPEVAEVAGGHEHVGLEEVAEAAHFWPEGQRGVEMEPGGPEEAASEAVALRAGSNAACVEPPDIKRSP